MKRIVTTLIASLGAVALCGCGVFGGDTFNPGEWEVQGWIEARPGVKSEVQTSTIKISENVARMGAHRVAFSQFYRGESGEDVTFANGEISGQINQRAVSPFPAHTQEVSGWYREDAFEMRISLPKIGEIQPYQVVSGRLIEAK